MSIDAFLASPSGSSAMDFIGKGVDWGIAHHEANRARSAQKEMYRKRYRWAMADMRKAGLNPILAARTMGPGTFPGVANAAGGMGPLSPGSTFQRTSAGRASSTQAKRGNRLLSLEEGKLNAEIEALGVQRAEGLRRIDKMIEEINLIAARTRGQDEQNRITKRAANAADLVGEDLEDSYDWLHDYTGMATPLAMSGALAMPGVRIGRGIGVAAGKAARPYLKKGLTKSAPILRQAWKAAKNAFRGPRSIVPRRNMPAGAKVRSATGKHSGPQVWYDSIDEVWRFKATGRVFTGGKK